ncbi:response regulator [Pantanalinema sp. GBBB05]|uniref:response regulator n=1 Tax=Pantanalinema sp. GBBB05 TaxID=2604139 RepID=UPI001D76BCC9|nr:response regulator [Pantanalinema sp. GBBB05]
MRILLIEDDEVVSAALKKVLGEQHYTVDVAADGQMGWELVKAFTYDLILLDIVLPKLDGIQLCQQLRAKKHHTPVLMLTAQSSSTDIVTGFEAGADDYVVKPFELSELLARIRVLLHRRGSPEKDTLEWLNLRLDPNICEVTYEGQVLHLTPKEYRLLELFMRNQHRMFTRSAILDHLWGCEEAPQEDTVTVHIKALRQKLKQIGAPSTLIETVYGQGYRLKQLKTTSSEASTSPTPESTIQQQTRERLAIVWEKYRGLSCDRLKTLENATAMWLANPLSNEQRQKAREVAHKLAGALGIFGFLEGSGYAREIEEIYLVGGRLDRPRSRRLVRLLKRLKELLEQSAISSQTAANPLMDAKSKSQKQLQRKEDVSAISLLSEWSQSPQYATTSTAVSSNPRLTSPPLLLVIDDAELAQQIVQLSDVYSISVKLTSNVSAVKQLIANQTVDILLLNLFLANATEAMLQVLLDVVNCVPPLPVLFFSDPDNLLNRVKVARLTSHTFLQRDLSPEQILDVVMQVRSHQQSSSAKLMVVDDDPQVLLTLRALLEPLGLTLCTLNNPLQFWHTLEEFAPDLLLLDVKMPDLNGIDLCRVLRHSYRWSKLPVLFLTAHADTAMANQIFAAGANECLSKAIADTDLVTRISNHLEQLMLFRGLSEYANRCLNVPRQQLG